MTMMLPTSQPPARLTAPCSCRKFRVRIDARWPAVDDAFNVDDDDNDDGTGNDGSQGRVDFGKWCFAIREAARLISFGRVSSASEEVVS